MNVFKRIAEAVLLGGIAFLIFIASFEDLLEIPAWLKVAGRMHPMFLHFPIVLLLISFLSAWIPAVEQNKLPWLGVFRLLASLSAVITAIMGLLLSLEEDRSGAGLQWHKWSGRSVISKEGSDCLVSTQMPWALSRFSCWSPLPPKKCFNLPFES